MCSIPAELEQFNADDPAVLTYLLGLPELTVTHLEFAPWRGWLVLHCVPVADAADCPTCGYPSRTVHQAHQRTVRDLPWAAYHCFLQVTRRRFDCAHCGVPFTERLAAVAPRARLTRRYATALFIACQEQTIQHVARQHDLGYKTVEAVYYRHAAVVPPPGTVRRLGIDEIALKKGHRAYILVLSDRDTGRVIALLPDRLQATLEAYLASWSAQQRAAVTDVMLDLWAPYHAAVAAALPQARRVADRFHVMKNLTDQVSTARRTLQRTATPGEREHLKGCRWLLVKNAADLTEAEQAQLTTLQEAVPLLGRLHALKEGFRSIFERTRERATASSRLHEWIATVETSEVPSLSKFVGTLRHWWEAILNYFPERLNSGFVEGLNNKLKLIKRRAFGFRNFAHFRLRVLSECQGTP